mmetsp:Transcript_89718/g.252979  ORF Transcript_89718/g.252979 Transcript_89718/m.252979 type:complete len:353 (-) Transcript_89718:1040-2098(-)
MHLPEFHILLARVIVSFLEHLVQLMDSPSVLLRVYEILALLLEHVTDGFREVPVLRVDVVFSRGHRDVRSPRSVRADASFQRNPEVTRQALGVHGSEACQPAVEAFSLHLGPPVLVRQRQHHPLVLRELVVEGLPAPRRDLASESFERFVAEELLLVFFQLLVHGLVRGGYGGLEKLGDALLIFQHAQRDDSREIVLDLRLRILWENRHGSGLPVLRSRPKLSEPVQGLRETGDASAARVTAELLELRWFHRDLDRSQVLGHVVLLCRDQSVDPPVDPLVVMPELLQDVGIHALVELVEIRPQLEVAQKLRVELHTPVARVIHLAVELANCDWVVLHVNAGDERMKPGVSVL